MNALERKKKELSDLQLKHHNEFIKKFRELKLLMKSLAETCDHEFQYHRGEEECPKCGITEEYFRSRAWQR